MPLTPTEVTHALRLVAASFPHFTDWQYGDETDDDHYGPALWGEYAIPDLHSPRHFFVTLDRWKEEWRGTLTIGQHAFMWTSADCGDAELVSTGKYVTLEEAIRALKGEMTQLFGIFTATEPLPGCGERIPWRPSETP